MFRMEEASMPKNAVEFGLIREGLSEISCYIKVADLLNQEDRDRIISQGQNLPLEIRVRIPLLVRDLANERMVYDLAGLRYEDGPPVDKDTFTAGVFLYFLVHEKDYLPS